MNPANDTENTSQSTTQGSKLAKIISIESVSIIATLLLFFMALNYFNIISLRSAFPPLSFLPQKSTGNEAIIISNQYENNKTILVQTLMVIGTVSKINGNIITVTNQGSTFTFLVSKNTMLQKTIPKLSFVPFNSGMIVIGDTISVMVSATTKSVPITMLIRFSTKSSGK